MHLRFHLSRRVCAKWLSRLDKANDPSIWDSWPIANAETAQAHHPMSLRRFMHAKTVLRVAAVEFVHAINGTCESEGEGVFADETVGRSAACSKHSSRRFVVRGRDIFVLFKM